MFASESLSVDHRLGEFDCGKDALNAWLCESATDQASRSYVNTFVWTEGGADVLAYFSLMGHTLLREDVPSKLGRGGPAAIPTILIAKLALDKRLQGQGLGAQLLIDATSRCVRATDVGPGIKAVVVDAMDAEAKSFYEHYGFTPTTPDGMRLYRKMSAIRGDLVA